MILARVTQNNGDRRGNLKNVQKYVKQRTSKLLFCFFSFHNRIRANGGK